MIDKMKEYMKQNGLNQRELAVKLGVGESVLNRWLNGRVKPSRLWARQIEATLGL